MMNGIGCGKGSNIVQHRVSTPVFAGTDCVRNKNLRRSVSRLRFETGTSEIQNRGFIG